MTNPARRLESKVAVVTGGCSGIGLATVERFLAEGARVVIADVQDDKGAELQSRFGAQAVYRRCDVLIESDIQSLMEFAVDQFGGLDVLFNNAGAGGSSARIDEIDGEGWDRTHALLLRSVALGMRYAAPHMKTRGGGSIINTASIAALIAGAAPVAYSAAKAGVLHLSKVSAAQLAIHKIRVNAICPGFIMTNIFSGMPVASEFGPEAVKSALTKIAPTMQPIAKPGLPEDIANAVLFFASDEAAFVTGTHLVVDGGNTVGHRGSWDPAAPTIGATLQALLKGSSGNA
jgi:NAD(P)-dependent dehydrogenase (short-subunit alcohol dehydrogenase family)